MKIVILLSGGLDSTTVLYLARSLGHDCYALSFNYGQRHKQELAAAIAVAQLAGVIQHQVISFDLGLWGGSALTDYTLDLPQNRAFKEMAEQIPITYVPARNTIFLSFALSYAEAIGATQVYAGMNAIDYSGYPDCRPDYIAAMQEVYRLGTKQGREGEPIQIITPLIDLTKPAIIQLGNRLGVPWAKTWSCYSDGGGNDPPVACGVCDSCRLRLAAFAELSLTDPLPYR
uniref:7-cyano-7-deazaguanine synthase n=1 Tax=Cyanothece sp. (strain PCC 7425 / ATCC 29141) TaxID=395961 RepID=QUEC_CYAP4|nr:RecName: Full=7-cyano-7-deazaguanine synthase; AltName: Full=7-cyano-7-carbaguanine synthase; AltName: Full=PreQ(0) synthase; AltName: Full=Queuosine biosynthesis protein QueC [Cyanothece sp. PCC 7425]